MKKILYNSLASYQLVHPGNLGRGGQLPYSHFYFFPALTSSNSVAFIDSTTCVVAFRSSFVVVVELLFYVHGKHLRSCRDGQLT